MSDTEVHQLLIRTLSEEINDALAPDAPAAEVVVAETLPPRLPMQPSIPNAAIWAHLAQMAVPLSRSNLVKPALRGKENDVLMVLLTGYDLQITMTQALAKVHIIEGQPSAAPELILGLIRREGHLAWPGGPESDGIEQADPEDITTLTGIVHAIRKDDPERIITARFSIKDAIQAGLVSLKNGKLEARSSQGKPLPWMTYPEDLLWARAVSRLGRRNFSDVLLGLSYVPEELAVIDVPSTVRDTEPTGNDPRHDPEMMPSRREELRKRIDALPDEFKRTLAERWQDLRKAGALRALDNLRESDYDAANTLLTNVERHAAEAKAAAPPCETDDAETPGEPEAKIPPGLSEEERLAGTPVAESTSAGDDASANEGLPFACDDPQQDEGHRVCPHEHQCREATLCLLAPF